MTLYSFLQKFCVVVLVKDTRREASKRERKGEDAKKGARGRERKTIDSLVRVVVSI